MMHTNMYAAIYTYVTSTRSVPVKHYNILNAYQALIDQSIRHFGINCTSVRYYGIRHYAQGLDIMELNIMGLEIMGLNIMGLDSLGTTLSYCNNHLTQ